MNNFPLPLLLVFLLLASCTEKETIFETTHTNEVVTGNTSPPFNGITSTQISNYVNKIFIDLLGRETSKDTLDMFVNQLKADKLSQSAREDILLTVMFSDRYKNEYYNRFHAIYTEAYLERISDEEIYAVIDLVFTPYYNAALLEGNQILAQLYKTVIDDLLALANANEDFASKQITINEYMQRLCTNFFYDEINMGAENFVISCFENFLKRLPTNTEKQAGMQMVDGFSAQLLFKDGNTRSDFTNIILHSDGFYEGLVIDAYRQLLAREPSSPEMASETGIIGNDGDFQALQRRIMMSEEYVGF